MVHEGNSCGQERYLVCVDQLAARLPRARSFVPAEFIDTASIYFLVARSPIFVPAGHDQNRMIIFKQGPL